MRSVKERERGGGRRWERAREGRRERQTDECKGEREKERRQKRQTDRLNEEC